MATETETVVAHPTVDAVDEKIETIVGEVKAVEEESSTPCKDIGEEESIKVEESQIVTSILAKSEEEEVDPKLESPAIEIKREDEADDKENDQIEPIPESQIPEDIKAVVKEAEVDPKLESRAIEIKREDEADYKENDQIEKIPESQIPEDIKAVVKEAVDPPPTEWIEQLTKDDLETMDVAAPAVETEPEEKTFADLPAVQESEEPTIAEVRDIMEPADNQEISVEPPADTVESSQEQDDQPITDPLVKVGGLLADTPAEKEQDDQPSVESVIKKEEEQPGVTYVEREREQDDKPSMEAVISEEEEQLTIGSSEKEQDEQQPEESVLKEAEEKLSLDSSEKEQEEQPSINLVIKEAEDQLAVSSVEKSPEYQPLAEPTTKEVEDQPEVEQEDQPSLSENSIPALEVKCEPTMEKEQPVSILPGEELEPAIVKETTYSDSGATNVESEPTTTMEMDLPVPVLPEEELEAAIVKEMTDSESGATYDENPQQEASRLDDRQTEQLLNTDEVCQPQGDAAVETVKDEGILAVDAENTTLVKEGEVCKEVKEFRSSEEERVEQSESAGGDDSTPPVPESIKEEVNESSAVEIVEKLFKDVVLTDEKCEEEDEETTVKTGELNKETEGVIAQLTTVEDMGSSLSTANVAKSSTEKERGCQEVDLIAANKIEEDVKDENAAVTETSEVEHIEKTVANLTTVTGDTTEVNTQRSVELSTEEMADADQITKLDVENQEPSTKDGDESKSSENQQKEVPSKPAQKHSNNILSKVKQSLVKAKKAIIGKSPGSKNLPSETKGDIQVK